MQDAIFDSRSEKEDLTQRVPVSLPNGAVVKVEVSQTSGKNGMKDVAFGINQFREIGKTIEGIAEVVAESISHVAPTKASVKFGLEVELEQGQLIAALVRGKGKTQLEITLEWQKSPQAEEKTEPNTNPAGT